MTQSAFTRALLDPDAEIPSGLVDPLGNPAIRRFSVYRNNVASGLTRVLKAAFPVVLRLVGEDFFTAMAGAFLRAHPPRTRMMMLYGADFGAFLETFPPVGHLPYLADVARLEQAIRESYHAGDAAPLDAQALGYSESRMLAARFRLAPSLRLIRSQYPVHAIWLANASGGPAPIMRGEDVVVLRPDFDPKPHLLPQGGSGFITALLAGLPLSDALAAAGKGFDLTGTLTLLLTNQALVGINE